jgi:ABC-type uncharacterized transport system permease subunit
MSITWLRVALAFYALGLLYVLVALTRFPARASTSTSTRIEDVLSRVALHAAYLGMVFHFVALAEAVQQSGELSLASLSVAASVLGFLIMVVFMIVYMVYQTTSPGIVVFPLVFLLTFVGASGQEPFVLTSSTAQWGWLVAHISLILAGYAALVLSFSASLLYLFQERALKAKHVSGLFTRLPPLQVTDEIGFRSLLIGFPFMTAGLVAGMVIAQAHFGRVDFRDAKILLSLLMWAVYLILLYTRWSAGWRGRRAAYLAAGTFAMAIVAWAANYFSTIHALAKP